MVIVLAAVVLLIGRAAGAQPYAVAGELRPFSSPFYRLQTDLEETEAREVSVRMTAMALEYAARTQHLGKRVPPGLAFWVFRHPDDYEAAGGIPGSAGQFDPNSGRLMAVFGTEANRQTWHTIQHEGFHQFAHFTIGGGLPPWLGEGLAEYFGEAIFTGDAFVSGAIPPARLERLRRRTQAGQIQPFLPFMLLGHDEWNGELDAANYDQAWSMVYFLLHADGGRYRPEFERFVQLISAGTDWQQAWRATLSSVPDFEREWLGFWQGLAEDPTAKLRQEACVRTLTSFWARAEAMGQRIERAHELLRLAEEGALAYHDDQWLPPSLARQAAADWREWEEDGLTLGICRVPPDPTDRRIGKARAVPRYELVMERPDGLMLRGRYRLDRNRVTSVDYLETLPVIPDPHDPHVIGAG